MGDDIGSGLSYMAICFDFCLTNIVQLGNRNPYFYQFRCHHPLITPTINACHHKIDILLPSLNDITLHQNINVLVQSLHEFSINYWREKQMFKAAVLLPIFVMIFEIYTILQLWS